MTRERELLLALAAFTTKAGHLPICALVMYPDEHGHRCSCGYVDVRRAADYFTRNEPV